MANEQRGAKAMESFDYSHYLLSSAQIRSLSTAEKRAYFEFAYGFTVQIDRLLRKANDKQQASSAASEHSARLWQILWPQAFAETSASSKTGTCIFAGWVSLYETEKGRANFCVEGSETRCENPALRRCFDFGIDTNDELCVEKNPLPTLTSRCADGFIDRLNQGEIDFFDQEKYENWRTKMEALISYYLASKVGPSNKSLKDYCAQRDDKDFLQKNECDGIDRLIAALRKKITDADARAAANAAAASSVCSTAQPQSVNACTKCGLRTELGSAREPSDKYMKLLEIMAVQCGEKDKPLAANSPQIRDRVLSYLSSIGSCVNFGKEESSFLEENYQDLVSGKKVLNKSLSRDFEKTFGMYIDDAKKAFCAEDYSSPKALQTQFNEQMRSNRRRNRATDSRRRSGWMNCDTELQLAQNRPFVEGIDEATAKKYGRKYRDQMKQQNLAIPTKRNYGPEKTAIRWDRKERRKWSPVDSGLVDERGKSVAALAVLDGQEADFTTRAQAFKQTLAAHCGGKAASPSAASTDTTKAQK